MWWSSFRSTASANILLEQCIFFLGSLILHTRNAESNPEERRRNLREELESSTSSSVFSAHEDIQGLWVSCAPWAFRSRPDLP